MRKRADRAHAIVKRIQDTSNLHLGVWDCPKDKKHTFTRQEFIHKAEEAGLLEKAEVAFLQSYWASILWRDLSD